jgi:hypothetical protein
VHFVVRHVVALGYVALVAVSHLAVAKADAQTRAPAKRECTAPSLTTDGTVEWYTSKGVRRGPRAPAQLGRALAGGWDFWLVETEGTTFPEVTRWTLQLVAADSVARTHCAQANCRASDTHPATGRIQRAPSASDSADAAVGWTRAVSEVRVSYNSRANRIRLLLGPPTFEPGDLFAVTEASDSAFTGRWQASVSNAGTVNRTELMTMKQFTTEERVGGYFCAKYAH